MALAPLVYPPSLNMLPEDWPPNNQPVTDIAQFCIEPKLTFDISLARVLRTLVFGWYSAFMTLRMLVAGSAVTVMIVCSGAEHSCDVTIDFCILIIEIFLSPASRFAGNSVTPQCD
jgi:hypothetical protein